MTFVRLSCVSVLMLAAMPALGEQRTKAMVDMQSVSVPTARHEPEAKAKSPSGPALTLDAFTARQQTRIQALIDKQIAYLQRMIKLSSPDDPQLPDYYFRLGELFTEKYRYWNSRARELDEEIYQAEHGGGTTMMIPRRQEQKRDEQRAEQSVLKAIQSFLVIVKNGSYARMDETLFPTASLRR